MSGSYATPLRLEFVASRRLESLLAITHGCALMLLSVTALETSVSLFMAMLVLIGYLYARRRATVRAINWETGDRIQLTVHTGGIVDAQLQPSAFVHPWLVVLQLREPENRRRYLPILPDMLPGQQFRQLRVRLLTEIPQLARISHHDDEPSLDL
ncbi:MAG: protein YgfX [Pseudomonadota bacterium]